MFYSQAEPASASTIVLSLLRITLLLFFLKESLFGFSSVSGSDTLAIDLDDFTITNFHGSAISLDKSTVVSVNFLEVKRLNGSLIEIVFFLFRFSCWLLLSGLGLIRSGSLIILRLGSRINLLRSRSGRFSVILCRLFSGWFSVFLIFFVLLVLLILLLFVFLCLYSLFIGAGNYGIDAEIESELSGGGSHIARVPRAIRVGGYLFCGCARSTEFSIGAIAARDVLCHSGCSAIKLGGRQITALAVVVTLGQLSVDCDNNRP